MISWQSLVTGIRSDWSLESDGQSAVILKLKSMFLTFHFRGRMDVRIGSHFDGKPEPLFFRLNSHNFTEYFHQVTGNINTDHGSRSVAIQAEELSDGCDDCIKDTAIQSVSSPQRDFESTYLDKSGMLCNQSRHAT
jgi:hypothetical protein